MASSVSVIIPIYNEEETLFEFFDRIDAVREKREDLEWSFVFVNDGSRDRSRDILNQFAEHLEYFKVIHLSRNFGHQIAVTAGLDHVNSDIVCIIDADLQDPPELLIEMIGELETGYNVVYGRRTHRAGESWFKVLSAKYFYRILNGLTDVEIPVDTGDFRVFDRKVHEALNSMRERHRFLRGMVAWTGFRSKAFQYSRDSRYAGVTKYSFTKMFRFASDAIFSFSAKPLHIAGYVGVAATAVGIMGLIYICLQVILFQNYLPGTSAVLFAVLLLGGIQLVTLGIIGSYIGRVFEQLKDRPLYFVDAMRNIHPSKAIEVSPLSIEDSLQ